MYQWTRSSTKYLFYVLRHTIGCKTFSTSYKINVWCIVKKKMLAASKCCWTQMAWASESSAKYCFLLCAVQHLCEDCSCIWWKRELQASTLGVLLRADQRTSLHCFWVSLWEMKRRTADKPLRDTAHCDIPEKLCKWVSNRVQCKLRKAARRQESPQLTRRCLQ